MNWMQRLGSAAALLLPWAALPAYAPNLSLSDRRFRFWAALWLGFVLPLALVDVIAGRWDALVATSLQLLVGLLAAATLRPLRANLIWGLLAALAVVSLLAYVESLAYARVWKAPGENPRTGIELSLLRGVDEVHVPATYRLWDLPHPVGEARLSFEAKLLQANPAAAPTELTASVALDLVDRTTALSGDRVRFPLSDEWALVEATFNGEELRSLQAIRSTLHIPPETVVAVRNVELYDQQRGTKATPLSAFPRQQLCFDHPNLLGHAAAVAGIAVATVATRLSTGVLGVGLALTAIFLSGSRAALLTLVAAAMVILRFTPWTRRRRTLSLTLNALFLFGLLAASVYVISEGRLRQEAGQGSRLEILSTTLTIIKSNLATGIGPGAENFRSHWLEAGGAAEVEVAHAHNWWLQHGVTHGLAGISAATLFSAGLLLLGWHSRRWLGLTLVGGALLLQLADFTLLHGSVLFPLVLTINCCNPGHTD